MSNLPQEWQAPTIIGIQELYTIAFKMILSQGRSSMQEIQSDLFHATFKTYHVHNMDILYINLLAIQTKNK